MLGSRHKYLEEEIDNMADVLYGCGCNDALFSVSGNKIYLDFDRKAESLDIAIESAKADIKRAGYDFDTVVVER